jgi:3-hydroxyisobutyrate dehydrogenase
MAYNETLQLNETVAVLGAGGKMGLPMTRNMARAGIPVRAWNRNRDRAAALEAEGVYLADSPADAARDAAIVVTMLSDEDAVLAVMDGPDGALSTMDGANHRNGDRTDDPYGLDHNLWLQMSTIGEVATLHCADLANTRGVGFVDAPVVGARQLAEAGGLVVLESGPEEARPRLDPIFDAIGQRTVRAGEAGAGSRLKTVVNSWVLTIVEAAAETTALAQGVDLDPGLFFAVIEGGALDQPYLRLASQAMMEGDFTPDFRLALAAKDAVLARDAAAVRDLDLPMIEAIARRMADGAQEHGDQDYNATYLLSAPADR